MTFDNPVAFFLLLFIPLLYILRYLKIFKKLSFNLSLGDWNGENFKWNSPLRNVTSVTIRLMFATSYILAVFACANPVIHKQTKIYTSRGSDILFVIDTSPSMAARDMGNLTRLEAAKLSVKEVLKDNTGDSIGLVEMAKDAAIVVVPTIDRERFFSSLDSLSVGELGDGSAIGMGLSCAALHLEHSSAEKKAVVLITDGENNAGTIHPLTASRLLKEKNISLYVFGLGTSGTAPLEYTDPKTGKIYSGYLSSSYNVKQLSSIAQEADGKFFDTQTISSLSQALNNMSQNEKSTQSYHLKNQNIFLYHILLYVSLLLFAAAWILRRIILREVL